MKVYEKQLAIKLRKQGLSINKISKKINCSTSSVSRWVRDIKLTNAQQRILDDNMKDNQSKAGLRRKLIEEQKRKNCQINGRQKARSVNNELFIIGCMLYWAEGSKSRNQLEFTNTDKNMLKIFIKFLRETMKVKDDDIALSVQAYTTDFSSDEIINFWLQELNLPTKCLRKCIFDKPPTSSSGKKKNKQPYGTCHIRISDTSLIQTIYGGICGIIDFEDFKWL